MKLKKHVVNTCLNTLEDAMELLDRKLQHDVFLKETAWRQLVELENMLIEVKSLLLEAKHGRRKFAKRDEKTRRETTSLAG